MTRSALSTPALLALVLGAAFAGGAVGFVLGGSSGAGEVHAASGAAPTIERRVEQRGEGSDLTVGLASPAPGARTTEAVIVRPRGDLDPAAVTRAVRATSRETSVDIPVGDGVIEGTIESKDGEPIANVAVLLLPARSEFRATRKSSSAAVGDEVARSLDEALRKAAEEWAEGDGLSLRTMTDASGKFAFSEVAEGRYRVHAELEGWRFRTLGPEVVLPGELTALEGRAAHVIRVALIATDGTPIARAMLRIDGERRDEWLEWTADEPEVYVDDPQFQIRAYAELFDVGRTRGIPPARLVSDRIAVDAATEETQTVTLVLQPRCVLVGRLIGESRGGGNSVFMLPLRPGESFDPTAKLNGTLDQSAWNGMFVFNKLHPGPYVIGVYGEEGMASSHRLIEVVDGLNEIVLERHVIDSNRCLLVRPLSPNGTRLEGVRYWFERQIEGTDPETEWISVRRDIGGVDLLDVEGFSDFDYDAWGAGTRMWLMASISAYGRMRVELTSGQRAVELQFKAPCELVVSIAGDTSIGGYMIKVVDTSIEREDPPQIATARQRQDGGGATQIGRDGTCRFRSLAPGPVDVVLMHASRWWGDGVEIARQELTLSGSEHRVEFQAITLCDLSVVITPAKKGQNFTLRHEKDDGEERYLAWGSITDDGRLQFRGLPPGDYIVVVGENGARLDVTLPSGEIRWDLSEHVTKLIVTMSKADGRLAQWGLQGGDLITAIDGEPIEDNGQLLARLDRDDVTVTVERGEETFELELPRYPRGERGKNPLGGWMYVNDR